MHPQHKHRQTVLPKKITRSIVAVVLALGLLVAGILPAFAESAINVNIPVREQGIGGMVLLEAEDGSSQQSASVGSYASANFALTYSEPGTYTYTIHQSSVYDGAIKDDTSYHVYVVIQSSDSGLSSAVVAVKTGDTKSQDIVFNNTKKDQKSETPKPNQPKPDQPKPDQTQDVVQPNNDEDLDQDSGHTGDSAHLRLWAAMALGIPAVWGGVLFIHKKRSH